MSTAAAQSKEGQTQTPNADSSVILTSIVFLAVIALLPFAMDFFVDLTRALFAQTLSALLLSQRWIVDAIGYTVVYLFMLFYMKTTFEPLRTYGYKWSGEYLWWSIYIGAASGVIMFLVDWSSQFAGINLPAFSASILLGYILTWGILPALVEETLFRGVIQTYYQKYTTTTFTRYKIHIAIIIAVVFEMLFHLAFPIYTGLSSGGVGMAVLHTLPQLIYVAVFGFIGGVIYQRTGSLVGPMLIHGLGNTVELLLLWLFR